MKQIGNMAYIIFSTLLKIRFKPTKKTWSIIMQRPELVHETQENTSKMVPL